MDDLSAKISQILSDPQALQQIKGLGEQLGISNTPNSSNSEISKNKNPLSAISGFSPDMMSMFTKIAPLVSDASKEDDTTKLLKALRPFLSEERRKKLDEASKLIKVMRLLPLLKEFNVFDSFL